MMKFKITDCDLKTRGLVHRRLPVYVKCVRQIQMLDRAKFPPRWNEERVKRVIEYYESQTEEDAVAEDEAAFGFDPESNNDGRQY